MIRVLYSAMPESLDFPYYHTMNPGSTCLGSLWVHRVFVSILLGRGSSFWQSCHSLRMESQMHHATTICTTILGDAPRFSKNAPRFRSMHQASFQNAPRKWEMHQAFSEMHQGKRENATGLSHSIKIVVLSHKEMFPKIRDLADFREHFLLICSLKFRIQKGRNIHRCA